MSHLLLIERLFPILQNRSIPMMTLTKTIALNTGHLTNISYLKVDIEGFELEAVPEWLDSGVLSNIKQIGMEFHTGNNVITKEERPRIFRQLLKSFLDMHELGFRLISYSPNHCVGQSYNHLKQNYYTFANIVFVKI